MAQHYWTAEDYAIGDAPSEWAITNATIEIAEDSNGDKFLDVTAPDENRSFLEYTPAPAAEDGEVWMRFQTGPSGDIWAFLRGQGLDTPGSVSMTRTDYMAENGFDRLGEFSNGSYGAIGDKPLTTPAGSIGQLRGSFDGDTLQGRWWDDGTAEPASWGLAGTTSVTGQGVAGVGHWRGSDVRIYEFGVGVGGDPAPSGITTRTRTIGGTFVDDTATPQPGATITVLNDDNDPPTVIGTTTTDSGGNWSLDVTPGITAHCLAEWVDGNGTPYRTESKPFINVGGGEAPDKENLVAHWDFSTVDATDGEAYSTVPDLSGNGHDLTGEGATHISEGINGLPSAQFDGVDDSLEGPSTNELDIGSPTTAASVYLTYQAASMDNVGTPLSQTRNGISSDREFQLLFAGTVNQLRYFIGGDRTLASTQLDTGPHMSAALYDRTSGSVVVSYDGETTSGTTGNAQVSSDPPPLLIGARASSGDPTAHFEGMVGEVLVYGVEHDIATHDEVVNYLDRWIP